MCLCSFLPAHNTNILRHQPDGGLMRRVKEESRCLTPHLRTVDSGFYDPGDVPTDAPHTITHTSTGPRSDLRDTDGGLQTGMCVSDVRRPDGLSDLSLYSGV